MSIGMTTAPDRAPPWTAGVVGGRGSGVRAGAIEPRHEARDGATVTPVNTFADVVTRNDSGLLTTFFMS